MDKGEGEEKNILVTSWKKWDSAAPFKTNIKTAEFWIAQMPGTASPGVHIKGAM